ncbi:flagellar biosynthetic protein FliQ [Schaalia naturae]|jgi:flagellar biosynthetic protein FliQ|uniref:Flagellar biosynthetic protein FliQ n=1 Tax=Schaalia naturae TaxID=635203 RepID=A0ABW2SM21_9ACTO
MTTSDVMDIAAQALTLASKLALPILVTALAVGLLISLLQSLTQVQDVTLTFVPKLIAVGVVIVLAGDWMLTQLVSSTQLLFSRIPDLLGG